MKQSFILWIVAVIITFLIGFIQNRTSPEYPISGTIGIEGQKVSYLFKRIHRDKTDYEILLRTDNKELNGIVKWKVEKEAGNWNIDTMQYYNEILSAAIPRQNALTEVDYKIVLSHKGKVYFLPKNEVVKVKFLGPVPASIVIHYFLTLFVGILLAVRAGLEIFKNKPKLRLYSIFTLISFFSCAMIFAPVKKAYELGVIGRAVPPIGEIFEAWLILLVIIWVMNLILISYTKNSKMWVIIFSALTILIFFSQNFF